MGPNSLDKVHYMFHTLLMYDSPELLTVDLAETQCAFTPVPHERSRRDGWTPMQQDRFIRALMAMGSVGAAVRAVGMRRASAYRLREREGAESFAKAWDAAIVFGRSKIYSIAMERAIEGVTTISVRKGGSVSIESGPDVQLISSVMHDAPTGPHSRQ